MTTTAAGAVPLVPLASSRVVFDDTPLVLMLPDLLIVATRQEYKQRALDALAAGRRHLVMDASYCRYIDASGFGALVSISKKLKDAGGTLSMQGANEDVRTLMELTKLDTLFKVLT